MHERIGTRRGTVDHLIIDPGLARSAAVLGRDVPLDHREPFRGRHVLDSFAELVIVRLDRWGRLVQPF